jgi:hypothetical protein
VLPFGRGVLHDAGRHLTSGDGFTGKACIDDQQQLAGAGLSTWRGHLAAGPEAVGLIAPAVAGQQPQGVGTRADSVPAPQEHQALALWQEPPQPSQEIPGLLLNGIPQYRAVEGTLQQVLDRFHVGHGMLKWELALVVFAHSDADETR